MHAGFNIARFDLPLLLAEFRRGACKFSLEGRMVFDAQAIFHRREPRTPEAALLLYCGQELEGAHDALADVDASIEVTEGPFGHHGDIPTDLSSGYALQGRWRGRSTGARKGEQCADRD